MKPPKYLPTAVAAVWVEITDEFKAPERIIGPEFDAYCGTVARLRDAQRRIADEQIIVPDAKNQPVAHPALTIERQASDDLRRWGDKFKARGR